MGTTKNSEPLDSGNSLSLLRGSDYSLIQSMPQLKCLLIGLAKVLHSSAGPGAPPRAFTQAQTCMVLMVDGESTINGESISLIIFLFNKCWTSKCSHLNVSSLHMEVCCMVPTQVKGSPLWDGKYIHARTRSSRLWSQICHWIAQKPEKCTTSPLSLDSITYIDGTTISKHYTNSVGFIDYFLFKNCVYPIMVDKNIIVQSAVPKPLSD